MKKILNNIAYALLFLASIIDGVFIGHVIRVSLWP